MELIGLLNFDLIPRRLLGRRLNLDCLPGGPIEA